MQWFRDIFADIISIIEIKFSVCINSCNWQDWKNFINIPFADNNKSHSFSSGSRFDQLKSRAITIYSEMAALKCFIILFTIFLICNAFGGEITEKPASPTPQLQLMSILGTPCRKGFFEDYRGRCRRIYRIWVADIYIIFRLINIFFLLRFV